MSTRLSLFVLLATSVFHNVPIINSLESPSLSQNTLDEWWVHRSVPTASENSNASDECIRDTWEYLTALHHHEPWAVQMYESSGKMIENLIHIEGGENVHHESGLFDGCLSVQSDGISFKGQYCTVFFGLEPVIEEESLDNMPDSAVENVYYYQKPSVGFCLPSTCTASDLRSAVAQQVGHRVSKGKNFSIVAIASEDYCYTEEEIHNRRTTFDNVTIIVLLAFGLLAVTVFTATGYDILVNKIERKAIDSSFFVQLLLCFSAKRNCKTLLETTENSKDDLSCLHGIRVLAICWIVLIHVGGGLVLTRLIYNRKMIFENTLLWQFQYVTNGLFAVNIFFFLSGLLVAFTQMRQLDQNGGFFNIKRFYGHRYMRLTPVYAFVLAFVATVYPCLGNGPDWNLIEEKSKDIRKNWWTNLLYINNYVHPTKNWWTNPAIGAGETWYLACDMQMLWISPLLIYPLWCCKRVGILCALASLLASLALSTIFFVVYDLPATNFWLRPSDMLKIDAYADKHYVNTFARFPSYIIGILLGWLLYKAKDKKIHINKCVVVAGWMMATLTGLTVTYGMLPYLDENTVPVINPVVRISYGVLHHSAWALVVGWIVFACTHGYGGSCFDLTASTAMFLNLNTMGESIKYITESPFNRFRSSVSVVENVPPVQPIELRGLPPSSSLHFCLLSSHAQASLYDQLHCLHVLLWNFGDHLYDGICCLCLRGNAFCQFRQAPLHEQDKISTANKKDKVIVIHEYVEDLASRLGLLVFQQVKHRRAAVSSGFGVEFHFSNQFKMKF